MSKEVKKTYIAREIKAKTFVPGPNNYDVTKADRIVTKPLRKSYR